MPTRSARSDEPLAEYDFSKGVRGKYYERYQEGTNVVLLDSDVAAIFPDSRAVNEALRLLVSLADAKAGKRVRANDRQTHKPKSRAVLDRGRR